MDSSQLFSKDNSLPTLHTVIAFLVSGSLEELFFDRGVCELTCQQNGAES